MIFSKDHKRKKTLSNQADPILDRVVYTFPNGQDTLTVRESCTSILVVGEVGSGKSSGMSRQFFQGLIKSGYGGLILCVKAEASEQMQKIIEKCYEDDTV